MGGDGSLDGEVDLRLGIDGSSLDRIEIVGSRKEWEDDEDGRR